MTTNTPQVAINDIAPEADLTQPSTRPSSTSTMATSSRAHVKVDHDEVLLDIAKTEGCHPSRELSISTTSTRRRRAVGDQIEASSSAKEDKEAASPVEEARSA